METSTLPAPQEIRGSLVQIKSALAERYGLSPNSQKSTIERIKRGGLAKILSNTGTITLSVEEVEAIDKAHFEMTGNNPMSHVNNGNSTATALTTLETSSDPEELIEAAQSMSPELIKLAKQQAAAILIADRKEEALQNMTRYFVEHPEALDENTKQLIEEQTDPKHLTVEVNAAIDPIALSNKILQNRLQAML